LIAVPITWRSKLQTGLGLNLTPSLHWRAPYVAYDVELNQGPVLVTVRYRVAPESQADFLAAIKDVGRERKRDGAYAWNVFEDVATQNVFTETFLIESWLELMHQHERVTNADAKLEECVRTLLVEAPQITHFVAPRRRTPFERILSGV
jgi:hypothetical protein